jgi:energy-coupling factor transporter ATP-binding protein EcfA2
MVRNAAPVEIYGITGRKGHGKSTFADLVASALTVHSRPPKVAFQVVPFAGPLKDMCRKVFGLTLAQVDDPAEKEAPFTEPIHVDEFLRALCVETGLGLMPRGLVARTPRELLQFVGTNYVRAVHDGFWIERFRLRIRGHRRALVPDLRFQNEAECLRAMGAKIIRVRRIDAQAPTDAHPSEMDSENIEADLEVGAVTGDLSLPKRVATLIARNRFDASRAYDWRAWQRARLVFMSGGSLEAASRAMSETKHAAILKNALEYYGVAMRPGVSGHRIEHRVIDGTECKLCTSCDSWLPLPNFASSSRAWDQLVSRCRRCASKYNAARWAHEREQTFEMLAKRFERNARLRGIAWNLTAERIRDLFSEQKGLCWFSGEPMTMRRGSDETVSIDRLDSSGGYEVGNAVLCCAAVNIMKNDHTPAAFVEWATKIATHARSRTERGPHR